MNQIITSTPQSRLGLRWSTYNVSVDHDGRRHIFNGVSGALEAFDTDIADRVDELLRTGTGSADLAPTLERMVTANLLVPDGVDERERLARRYRRHSTARDHLGLTIVTSMGCNFDCPYCFEHKVPRILDDEVAEEVRRLVRARLAEVTTVAVTWYGGEPLLATDQLVELSCDLRDECEAAGASYESIILTNGWFLDAATARRLTAAGVAAAQVTIDGPPDVHDAMRPHASGRPTFERILANLVEAVDEIHIGLRVNVDGTNVDRVAELLDLLADAGLAGRVQITLGHLLPLDHNPAAPSASYSSPCLSMTGFGDAQLAFDELARAAGFAPSSLPSPLGSACTAVKTNELIVGAGGELWKCIDDAGDASASVGSIFDLSDVRTRAAHWFAHDPFSDPECMDCIALPVCMGGCALVGRLDGLRDNRCSTFRTHHVEQVRAAVVGSADGAEARRRLASLATAEPVATPVPVTIGTRR